MKINNDFVCLFVFFSWWTKSVKATPWYNKKSTLSKNCLRVVTTYLNSSIIFVTWCPFGNQWMSEMRISRVWEKAVFLRGTCIRLLKAMWPIESCYFWELIHSPNWARLLSPLHTSIREVTQTWTNRGCVLMMHLLSSFWTTCCGTNRSSVLFHSWLSLCRCYRTERSPCMKALLEICLFRCQLLFSVLYWSCCENSTLDEPQTSSCYWLSEELVAFVKHTWYYVNVNTYFK